MVTSINPIIQTSLNNAISPPIFAKLSADNPIFVACSGGRDSMALLYALSQMQLPIVALHVNHRIQTPSDDWEKMVKDFCHIHDIAFFAKQLAFTNPENVSEQQARNARYQALIRLIQDFYAQTNVSEGYPIPILVLAHHANDQAETILMNLCQGTGIQGLSGMSEWAVQEQFSKPLHLWRPLLTLTREQISDYAIHHNLPYVDDPTNVGDGNQRAFLRQHILPQLGERFGGLVQNITRTSHNLAQASHLLNSQAIIQLEQCQIPTWTTALQCLDIAQLRQLSQEQRLYLLHFWLKQHMTFAPPRRYIEAINQLIFNNNPDQQTILQWENQQIRRYRNHLYLLSEVYIELLEWAEKCNQRQLLTENSLTLATVGDYDFQLRFTDHKLPTSLSVRRVQIGEKFQRLAQAHHQTFKNICQTLSVPSWQRPLTLVVQGVVQPSETELPLVLVFPSIASQTVWLAGAEQFVPKTEFTLKFSQ